MNPWELVLAHRYTEALVAYEACQQAGVDDALECANRSTAFLCLGRLTDALDGFRQANELASQRLRGESQPYLGTIGSVLWMLGKRDEAVRMFTAAVDGVVNRSNKFADNAGGVSQGLLLWYAGVTEANEAAKEHSQKYLRKLAKKPRIKEWPGPLALFVLGQKTRQDVLLELCGTSEVETSISKAAGDLLKRRRLAKTLFYFAAHKRSNSSEEECRAGMVRCAEVENPIVEIEWYLARAEAYSVPRQTV